MLQRLLERGLPMPNRLTVSHDARTAELGEDELIRLLRVSGQQAASLELIGGVVLATAAAALSIADALPALQHLRLATHSTPTLASVTGLLSSFGSRLLSFSFGPPPPSATPTALRPWKSGPPVDMDALALLRRCQQMRKLHLTFNEPAIFPFACITSVSTLRDLELQNLDPLLSPDLLALSALSALTRLHIAASFVHPARGHDAEGDNDDAVGAAESDFGGFADSSAVCVRDRARRLDSAVKVVAVACRLPQLRELALPWSAIDTGCLVGLQRCSMLTSLQVKDLLGATALATAAADLPPAPPPALVLPPALHTLCFTRRYVRASMLAALAPCVPATLRRVDAPATRLGEPLAGSIALGLQRAPPALGHHHRAVEAAVPTTVRAAVSLLQGRVFSDDACQVASSSLEVNPWEEVQPMQREGQGPLQVLLGPHAPWLRELAPLAPACREVMLESLALGVGDMAALAATLPSLGVLALSRCRWPPKALLELAPLERLAELRLDQPREGCMLLPAAMAALLELCARAPALARARLSLAAQEVEALMPAELDLDDDGDADEARGAYGYEWMVRHLASSLHMRGAAARVEVGVDTEEAVRERGCVGWWLLLER